MTVLTGETIRRLCQGDKPLIRNAVDLDTQIQPNGCDLTLKSIEVFGGSGIIDFDNKKRRLPPMTPKSIIYNDGDIPPYYRLLAGSYVVTFNEIVNIPNDIMGRACPRSSLMRCGVSMNTAIWDAGYEGQSQALINVMNPDGISITVSARIVQIVFEELDDYVEKGYTGVYQGEGVSTCK